jgi:hypothetical protein
MVTMNIAVMPCSQVAGCVEQYFMVSHLEGQLCVCVCVCNMNSNANLVLPSES